MEKEVLDTSKVVFTRMIIGNEHGRITDIDLTKPCTGEDCISINYQEDGKMIIS